MQKQLKSMALLVAGLAWSAGCQQDPPPPPRMPQELANASQALADRQPDAAISDAGAYLQANPHGPSAAGAHYLLGRAYFMKVATDPAEQRQLFQSARSSYELALHDLSNDNTVSDPSLEADIRGELSNVAWYQDDFPATIQQAQIVYNMPGTPPAAKRFLLYRIGASQQRLGNFDAAVLTFRQVQMRFPGTLEARDAQVQEKTTRVLRAAGRVRAGIVAGPGAGGAQFTRRSAGEHPDQQRRHRQKRSDHRRRRAVRHVPRGEAGPRPGAARFPQRGRGAVTTLWRAAMSPFE